ncbi:MAG TPA: hypothetical protein VF533_13335 [Solirubrobacteraceae bacterium]|jgi:hypothetical protein
MFRFVQWELAGSVGPVSGRYVVRPHAGEGAEHVLVIAAGSGSAPARRGRRWGRESDAAGAPAAVPLTRATVIEAEPEPDLDRAQAWLETAAGEGAEATVAAALAVLNRAVRGHRIAAADPYVAEVAPWRALVTRVGYGTGDEVADARWTEARELQPPPVTRAERRDAALRPQERLAALLGGRDAALACEELTLRGRLDLDHGRDREAALQVHLALEAARVELAAWGALTGMADRIGDLDARRDAVAGAANEALQGGLRAETRETVAEALARVEAALRARAAAGAY